MSGASSSIEPEAASTTIRAMPDRLTFEAVYREFRGPIYGYCYSRLGTVHAAEDATQQVFTQALA